MERVFDTISGPGHKERFPASISVSLLLTHGRSGRLFMVRHGQEWGLIAGAVEIGENPWHAILRESQEEAHINSENIIFVKGRDTFDPHVILIRGEDKNRIGLVYGATYSGPKFPFEGNDIKDDKSINRVACFSWKQILNILEDPDKNIYRPEFNFPQLIRWTLEHASRSKYLSRALVVDNWFLEKQENIKGLTLKDTKKIEKPSELLSKWNYVPNYNSWMTAKNIHGDPSKTNFARSRFNSNY